MKTGVIYARYSSDRQTEQSIEGQLRVCKDFASRNDILIVEEYIDRAMTGTNDNRYAFQKMLKDSTKKAWDIVLVYKLDRFSRNKYEMAKHKKTLKDNGVKLVSAMENIPDTPEGIILESLLEGMAEYYSAELSQKVRRGMNETRIKGNFTGGAVLYGYKVVNKKVLIDEEKAPIVKYIYEEYAKGTIVEDIINSLTERGVLNKGKPFAKNTIYNILKNEKYNGIFHHNGEAFTNTYPKIIPDDLFAIIQKRNNDNHYGKRSLEANYLLRQKLKCGYCGCNITADTGTAKNGTLKRYYKCSGKRKGNNCNKTSIRKDVLESLVVDTTLKIMSNAATIDKLANKLIKNAEKRMNDNTIIKMLIQEQKQLQTKIDNFLDAISQGIVTPSTKQRLNELEARKLEIAHIIAIEESKKKLNITKDDIVAYITKALKKSPQQMINLLIKEIILYDDKIEIIYNYTSKNPDDNHQGSSFYIEKTSILRFNANTQDFDYIPFVVDLMI